MRQGSHSLFLSMNSCRRPFGPVQIFSEDVSSICLQPKPQGSHAREIQLHTNWSFQSLGPRRYLRQCTESRPNCTLWILKWLIMLVLTVCAIVDGATCQHDDSNSENFRSDASPICWDFEIPGFYWTRQIRVLWPSKCRDHRPRCRSVSGLHSLILFFDRVSTISTM
jgi:hypothetical protein